MRPLHHIGFRSLLAGVALLISSCGRDESTSSEDPSSTQAPEPAIRFEEVTAQSGITFRRDNGFDGESFRVVETVNGGVATFDYDGDGLLDIYFTNGRKIDPGATPPVNELYRNLGGLRFENTTKGSGTDDPSLSMGCAVADIDGDAREDIYVTNLGPNRLYRNLGEGRFEDIAPRSGVATPSMDAGCVFFDMDRDGDLDLYVASYVNDTRTEHPPLLFRGVPGYWPPRNYEPAPDHLYENRGGGRFVDVSDTSGIHEVDPGRGLGVIADDFDGDGNVDLFVANDLSENFMFLGDGKGHFEEHAFLNGTAFGEAGEPLGSMGLATGDFDADGRTDLFVTNYHGQLNNLYRHGSSDEYEERARISGVAAGTQNEVSWGAHFADFDHDGHEDLFVVNGHLNPGAKRILDTTSYEQVNRVFRNLADGRFEDVSSRAGEALAIGQVGRGSATADLDNDGDLDLIVANSIGAPQLLRNDSPSTSAWCLIRLIGKSPNSSAIGARVTVTAGAHRQTRERQSASGYLSVNDSRLHLGLGAAEKIDRLEVRWPDGSLQSLESLPARRLITIRQGRSEFQADTLSPASSE